MELEAFKKYLPYLRTACGYSQIALCNALDLSHATYLKIENGIEPIKRRDYYAIRYLIEKDEFGKSLLDILVDGKYLSGVDRAALVVRLDKVIKKSSRKSGIFFLRKDLIKAYNEFIIERKAAGL